ncbi:hypothetical protein JGUZn3_09450 [Entomobacter blattae]|uniref:Uncharacterized protein n=2 Tax=Entomobacter blattae TaxID=2762277 RepID=A0A7H1NQW6_9PROT|nr:hypothetical protein JGUZn3_09450 [Entomobacter blattae]
MKPSKMATTYLLGIMLAVVSGDMNLLPSDISCYVALLVIICNLIASHVKPPQEGSKLVYAYQMISWLAGNFGWAQNKIKQEMRENNPPLVGKNP